MASVDMKHMEFLEHVTRNDVAALHEKEKTYRGSWKKRGGVGAFMMLARKWDRIEEMLSYNDGTQFNIFAAIEARRNGDDGTVLAEIRDLRRYLVLVEAEMMARGVVCCAEKSHEQTPREDSNRHAFQRDMREQTPSCSGDTR